MSYWPEVIQAIKEFKAIAAAEDPEITEVWSSIDDVFSDQYIESATLNGVKRLEAMLGIVPRATETVEDRKFTILTKWNEQLPYTDKSLRQRLDTLCGTDGYTMTVGILDYTVTVRVELTAKNQFDAVGDLLDKVVPMNMIIDIDLRYNQNSTLSAFTHGQLSVYTHDQLRNEVIS